MPTNYVTATTQDHLDIEEVKDGYLILKNGAVAAVLETSSVNFNLLSEIEQDAIIAAFSMLLNSITFPMQVLIRSERLDISKYIEKVRRTEENLKDPLLREHATAYRKFVQSTIRENDVLDKKFYVVIPQGADVGKTMGSSPFDFLSKLFGGSRVPSHVNVDRALRDARKDIDPKIAHVIKEFTRIGIKVTKLDTQELVELFFNIYNPSTANGQRIRTNVSDYTTAVVNPAMVEE